MHTKKRKSDPVFTSSRKRVSKNIKKPRISKRNGNVFSMNPF